MAEEESELSHSQLHMRGSIVSCRLRLANSLIAQINLVSRARLARMPFPGADEPCALADENLHGVRQR
jgi:hypothetical protein